MSRILLLPVRIYSLAFLEQVMLIRISSRIHASAVSFTLLAVQSQTRWRKLPILYRRNLAIHSSLDPHHICRVPHRRRSICRYNATWKREECLEICLDNTLCICLYCGYTGIVGRKYHRSDVSIILVFGSPHEMQFSDIMLSSSHVFPITCLFNCPSF